MSIIEILLIGVGLSMDAFAVSIAKGLGMPKINWRHAAIIALFFGAFQALMPAIGYFVGSLFASYVQAVDHWIAFILLAIIGGKMLFDAFRDDDGEKDQQEGQKDQSGQLERTEEKNKLAIPQKEKLNMGELFMLAIATSIDALAVGVSFAFLEVNLVLSVSLIGITTFVISFIGVGIGNFFGSRWEKPATILGGLVLIFIGARILLEGLGILA